MTGSRINLRLYTKLAWNGIQKNHQLYYPYLLSGITMAAVFYILAFLSDSKLVHSIRGGGAAMTTLLIIGSWLVGMFSIPFLFYTSSALVRKRKKELGLYYILGMNRKNITVLMLWESLITYVIVVPAGIFAGILFSKAAELGLVNIMGEEINYRIYIDGKAAAFDALLYAGVYFCIFLNAARQVRRYRPIDLVHSDSMGERPPRDRWALVIVGAVMTGAAYVLACSVDHPREAVNYLFMIAVLVIAGTYLLFIAGSVFLCRALQKNKHYYYQTSHFVMISSLTYRMKRNGAGLASICILSTAILVALTGSVVYYAGTDGIVERVNPYDLSVQVKSPDGMADGKKFYAACRTEIEDTLLELGVQMKSFYEVNFAGLYAPVKDGVLDIYSMLQQEAGMEENVDENLDQPMSVRIMQLSDYNKLCGADEELGEDEVLIVQTKADHTDASEEICQLRSWDERIYTVKNTTEKGPKLSSFRLSDPSADMTADSIFAVTADLKAFWEGFDASNTSDTLHDHIGFFWEYDADLEENADMQRAVHDLLDSRLEQSAGSEEADISCNFKVDRKDRMKSLTGGLMFLAFVICVVFVFVATLIMYYKQISEGYEDQKQFLIMQKVGMKKKEIKRSINSQMLTVFGFPLIAAGIHLAFMLPMINQLMRYAALDDKPLLIKVTIISYLSFAVAYAFVYKLTTRTYFKIVNKKADH